MSEEHVFVTDIGSSSVKAGYSGEDIPSFVFPSTVTLSNIKNLEVKVFDLFLSYL